jgi:AcrR family transcriptional regulator
MAKSRPGGRTARTKAAAFEATASLLAERGPDDLTMTDIAARAGVAATSLYRRWGDVGTLLREVAAERLMREAPLPDTGTLADDLKTWARSIVASFQRDDAANFFRVIVATVPEATGGGAARSPAIMRRLDEIAMMLERARQRGERAPRVSEILDYLLAPLYMRALFGPPADEKTAERLVERLLALPIEAETRRKR